MPVIVKTEGHVESRVTLYTRHATPGVRNQLAKPALDRDGFSPRSPESHAQSAIWR
jgi:hypothetical protein